MSLPKTYGYYINLDERGCFSADVRDLNDNTIWEITDVETANDLVEGGFVKDVRNPDDIESYLVENGILDKGSHVFEMKMFENLQEKFLESPSEYNEDSDWYGM